MDPERRHRRRHAALAWALLVPLVLGMGWERFAAGYAPEDRGLVRKGAVTYRAATDLARTRAELPEPAAPRIVLFGSSQIATVTDKGTALAGRLHEALERDGRESEVVDFSAGGQQTLESMAIWLASAESSRPSVLVIGVSLFSMLSLDVRGTLLAAIDAQTVRGRILRAVPAGAPARDVQRLTDFTRQGPERVSGRGETLQQRVDRVVGAYLGDHFAAVANRQAIFDELLDRPVRRDLRAWLQRGLRAARTARTYTPNEAYGPSLLALEVMQGHAADLGVAMVVVLLPFDATRPPVPFLPETMERMRNDLDAAAARTGFDWIDASGILGTAHFGDFADGSPDDLHFDSAGHVALAAVIAPEVAALLPPAPAD